MGSFDSAQYSAGQPHLNQSGQFPADESTMSLRDYSFSGARTASPATVLQEAAERLRTHEPALMRLAREIGDIVCSIPADPIFGQDPRALIVGGLVRDVVAGTPTSKDLDLEVYGVSMTTLIDTLRSAYGEERVIVEGESFQAIKVFLDDQLIDVTIPRRDSKSGVGHKGFVVEGDPTMSLGEAVRRRDFTINGFAADPFTGEIFDPCDGCADLIEGVLRVIDAERFSDDPLRVYRGVQFAARLNLTVEPQTMALMQEMVDQGQLGTLAKARVTEEMHKLLVKADAPSHGLTLMRELGIIEKHWPELHALIGVPQDPEWHPEGDVWVHTLMVVDAAREIIGSSSSSPFSAQEAQEILWAALLHDLGKPATTVFSEGRYRAHGHEEAGAQPAGTLLERLEIAHQSKQFITACVERHLTPAVLYQAHAKGTLPEKGYANAVRKVLRHVGADRMEAFLAVSEADHRGRTTPGAAEQTYRPGEAFRDIAQRHGCAEEAQQLLISGKDLIALGLPPGKLFGELQRQVEHARDAGTIGTKEEALLLVKRLIAEH